MAPERVPGMITSMLADYKEVNYNYHVQIPYSQRTQGGWLPMWKNIVETNIMVCVSPESELNLSLHTVFRLDRMLTHSSIAEAVIKGVVGFDRELAWEAVWKDATVAPQDDSTVQYVAFTGRSHGLRADSHMTLGTLTEKR